MICRRCRTAMVRVVNQNQNAYATCNRCGKFVECAVCPKCQNITCVQCYNKPPPTVLNQPLIPTDPGF